MSISLEFTFGMDASLRLPVMLSDDMVRRVYYHTVERNQITACSSNPVDGPP